MKLEDQCVSLDLARQLKELGVEQNSYFKWEERECGYTEIYHSKPVSCAHKYYSAFTVAELFDLLPAIITTKKSIPFNNFFLKLVKRTTKNIQYIINYECDTKRFDDLGFTTLMDHNIYDEKLADCLAKMLIHLIKNKIITFGKVYITEHLV